MDTDPPSEPPDPGGSDGSCVTRKRVIDNSEHLEFSTSKKTLIHPNFANPSLQTVYVNLFFSDGPYSDDDKGPFIIHVSREVADPSAGTSLRAIKFGQFLHKSKINDIIKDGVKNIGRNRILVEFSTAEAANNFLNNSLLKLEKYIAVIPTFNATRIGFTRGVPVDWSMEELVESLELPPSCGAILKARRLNRKVYKDGLITWIPTQSVVLTFKGQILPSNIYSYHTSLPIETYTFPTIICLNCCRYAHIKTQCRSQPRCFKYAKSHSGESCVVEKNNATSIQCSAKHFATDKDCPGFSRQQSIKIVMSTDHISYIEASARFLPSRGSYSDVAKELFSPISYFPRAPIVNINFQVSPKSHSYKQTVVRSPRPRPIPGKGYDVHAHKSIISDCPSSAPNGCVLERQTVSR